MDYQKLGLCFQAKKILIHNAWIAIRCSLKDFTQPILQLGGFVRAEIIEPLDLSVTATAKALGITKAALSTFLNERSSLSPDMAIRLDKAFGVSMETLMRMQNSFDIAQAHEHDIVVLRYVPDEKETSVNF